MKIILFGSTGMLGNYVHMVLSKTYDVRCINRAQYDIAQDDVSVLNQILSNIESDDIIINCCGAIPQKNKLTDYKTYILVNTLFPHRLETIANHRGAHFIHITTDCVFDGRTGNYNEQSEHTAQDIYGISKSLGEPESATIIRTSIIGEELSGKKSLLEWVLSNRGGEINGYTNHYWNGVTCLTLAAFIKSTIDTNNFWKGVQHVYSKNVVSKYELCCYINEIYDLNIRVHQYEDKTEKNMTLSGINNIAEAIFDQIKDQKQYSITKN
jgi:dTDP-4-dehydrorhamnose reductase